MPQAFGEANPLDRGPSLSSKACSRSKRSALGSPAVGKDWPGPGNRRHRRYPIPARARRRLEGTDKIVVGKVQLAQVARRAVAASARFRHSPGVSALSFKFGPYWRCSSSRQSLGRGGDRHRDRASDRRRAHAEENARGNDPTQGNFQASCQFQRNQPQGQMVARVDVPALCCRLTPLAGRKGVASCCAKPRSFDSPQQRLRQFAHRQHRQDATDPPSQLATSASTASGRPHCHARRKSTALPRTAQAVNVAGKRKTIGAALHLNFPGNASF